MNDIRISGCLYIEVECPICGSSIELDYDVNESLWLSQTDVEISIVTSDIIRDLQNENWVESNGKYICPECAEELLKYGSMEGQLSIFDDE